MSAHAQARADICRVGHSLFNRGYVHGSTGNISMRLPNGEFLITPTDACLGMLEPEKLALLDPHGNQLSGERASKTLALHREIYRADPQANCVVHTHSAALVELSLRGVWKPECVLPPITPYQVMKVGQVPLIPYHRPGDPLVAQLIAAHIQHAAQSNRALRAVLVERLGPNVWHANAAGAMALLEELEETAKLWLRSLGQPAPLSAEQIQELNDLFGARWA
jgi:3-dehydro-4-phosphotetronate decarboxylase